MRFIKMQACGNDYIYVDCMHDLRLTELAAAPPTSLIMALCDRHCGVGADGVVFITLGVRYRMTIYNADGSRAKTCGNALRCVAHYLFTRYGVIFPLSIDTDSGTRMITQASAAPPRYTVQMGRADTVGIGDACGYDYRLVDVGNRHVAVCCDDVRRIALDKEANDLCAAIAQGALNVEFYLKQASNNYACAFVNMAQASPWGAAVVRARWRMRRVRMGYVRSACRYVFVWTAVRWKCYVTRAAMYC